LVCHIKEGHRLRVFENRVLGGDQRLWVIENRVLRNIFDLTSDELKLDWRRLYNDAHSSQNIIRVIEIRRRRWARHVARMEEKTGVYRSLVGSLRDQNTWKIQA
jgi:hypothetical protein